MLSPLLTNTVTQSRNQKFCENAELHLVCIPFGTGNTYKKHTDAILVLAQPFVVDVLVSHN